jgi:FkbM family methyltransferase
LVHAWRARKPGTAQIAGESFVLTYPFSRFDAGSEAPTLEAFRDAIRPGDVVFDIGANAGVYSLLAARVGARVSAFEPSEAAARLTRAHLDMNDLDAEVVEVVITDHEGEVDFYEQGAANTSSLSRASALTGEKLVRSPIRNVRRPATTIDAFCRQRGVRPRVVKLDVEGAEVLALRGASQWLSERDGLLLLEIHPWSLATLGQTPDHAFAQLAEAGWRAELLGDNGNTQHYRVTPDSD